MRLKFLSLETQTQSQLMGLLLHELAAPLARGEYGRKFSREGGSRSITPNRAELVRPGGYQGDDREKCRYPKHLPRWPRSLRPGRCQENNREGAIAPAAPPQLGEVPSTEDRLQGRIAQLHPRLGHALRPGGARPRAQSPSCTTSTWADEVRPEGCQGMTTEVSSPQQHYPHVG